MKCNPFLSTRVIEKTKNKLAKNLYLIFLLLLLLSCQKEDADIAAAKPNAVREFLLIVKDSKINCTGYEGQKDCFLVQMGSSVGTNEWEYFYEKIEGFDYQEGFIYKLLVRKENVENPPMDAASERYFLVQLLSKEEVK